jgi:hypothetical protein
MIWWLVDHVNMIYFLLGLVLLGVGVLFWQNKRGRDLLAMFLVIGIGVLVWFLCSLVMTDRKQVENNMRALADAALFNRPNEIEPFLAKDFQYNGMTRSEIAVWVTQMAKQQGVNGYNLTDFRIEKDITRDKDQGRAEATFMLRVDGTNGSYLTRCRTIFVLEEGQWRLQSFTEEKAF